MHEKAHLYGIRSRTDFFSHIAAYDLGGSTGHLVTHKLGLPKSQQLRY